MYLIDKSWNITINFSYNKKWKEKSKKKPAVYGKEEFEPIDIEEEPTDLKNNEEENDNVS
mgnify:CR=1 FL=1